MKLYFPLIFILVVGLLGCDLADSRFTLINASDRTISFCIITQDTADEIATEFYSERFYIAPNNTKMPREYVYIKAGQKQSIPTMGNWDNTFQDLPSNKDFIYVIDSAEIGENIDTLKKYQLIRKYRVSYEYMKAHNWQFEIK